MSGYIGVEPVPKATRVRTFGTTSTSTNTISIPGGFTPGNIEVFIDGYYVLPTDYDDSDGFNLVFIQTLDSGTDYVVMEARTFEVADHYTKQQIRDAAFDFNTMPTVGGDPFVESGSNADGGYVKFADGTMECFRSYPLVSISAGGSRVEPWNFAAAFITDPEIYGAPTENYSASLGITSFTSDVGPVLTSTATRMAVFNQGSAARDIGLNVRAIGRWF